MMLHALFYLLFTVWGNAPADLTELRVEPAAGLTEVVILTSGEVAYSDFMLTEPARLVVDLKGARHSLPRRNFEDISRGGVMRLRTSQFREDVVRVVVELVEPTSYTLTRRGSEIRVSFPNLDGLAFEAWASGAGTPQVPTQVPAQVPNPDLLPAATPMTSASVNATLQNALNQPSTEPPPIRVPASAPSRVSQQDAVGRQASFRRQETMTSVMPRITVTFENTDIRDVLNNFAEFTGKSFVPGAGVDGNVTADIRNQPWDLALRAILEAHGLTAIETGTGIIRVDRLENLQERQQLVQLETQVFKVNYVPVLDLATALTTAISERGKVIPNEATNSLIVTDLEENLQIVRQLIQDLDVRTPQVVINAKIIFVDRTEIEELGIGYDLKEVDGNQLNAVNAGPTNDPRFWELVDSDFDGVPDVVVKPLQGANQVAFSGSSVAALANARDRLAAPALEVIVAAALGDFRLISFLDALQRLDLSDIVAAPTIQTMDNQQASILVGERTPIRVIDSGAGGGTGGQAGEGAQAQFPQATVRLEETGIILEVTPHITNNRQIVVDLHAERSGVSLAPGDIGFTFQTQEGTTRLILNDGETGVIGGLTVSEVTKSVSGVPILMDLPLIGGLFRVSRSDENKRDLLILVTPHIVDDAVGTR